MQRLAGIVALATLIQIVATQATNATCLAEFEWMTNSRGQSPCLVAAYLLTPCYDDPMDAFINNLPEDSHYTIPTPSSASTCNCASVYYSMLQACAVCQNRQSDVWSTWATSCPTTYQTVYPHNIPSGTSVPAWAYLDVTRGDNFNATAAKALADTNPPESTSTSGPSGAVTSLSSSTTSDSPLSPPSIVLGPTGRGDSKSQAGAIAGGVIGGLVGLVIVILAFWYYRKQVGNPSQAPSTMQVSPEGKQAYSGQIMSNQQQSMSTLTLAHQSVAAPIMIYNPNDPTTFPSVSSNNSSGPTTAYTGNQQRYPISYPQAQVTGWIGSPVRYKGIPEL
ncbi:hypothetical protein QCA50_006000 [Cerrena zonata]|uniref:Uncharacterized protein n=1 Tax=Cerrena zonata TaxID=2478898 RepID=A0AAW0GBT6_9APHY